MQEDQDQDTQDAHPRGSEVANEEANRPKPARRQKRIPAPTASPPAAQARGSEVANEEANRLKPAKRQKRNPAPTASPSAAPRRSTRIRVSPLRHWKNERVIYGRSTTTDGKQRVLGMVDVVRFPKEEVQPFAERAQSRKASARLKSESVHPTAGRGRPGRKASAKTRSEREQPPDEDPPAESWDSETQPNALVYSFTKQKYCERPIVHTKHMNTINFENKAGRSKEFAFQRVCRDSDYMTAGLMFIPVGGGKPMRPAKDNFFVFTVLEGAVSVQIHETTVVVGPMGLFWVPRGNAYSITNISDWTVKMSFTQTRRAIGEEPIPESDHDDEQSPAESSPTPLPAISKRLSKGKRRSSQMTADE